MCRAILARYHQVCDPIQNKFQHLTHATDICNWQLTSWLWIERKTCQLFAICLIYCCCLVIPQSNLRLWMRSWAITLYTLPHSRFGKRWWIMMKAINGKMADIIVLCVSEDPTQMMIPCGQIRTHNTTLQKIKLLHVWPKFPTRGCQRLELIRSFSLIQSQIAKILGLTLHCNIYKA